MGSAAGPVFFIITLTLMSFWDTVDPSLHFIMQTREKSDTEMMFMKPCK